MFLGFNDFFYMISNNTNDTQVKKLISLTYILTDPLIASLMQPKCKRIAFKVI